MAGKVRHLLNRDGRYFARLVVPKDLRPCLEGKTELRTPLGPHYRTALKLLPGAVAELQHKIALAQRRDAPARQGRPEAGRYPLAPDQRALRLYAERVAFDDQLRNDARWPSASIDDALAQRLRGHGGRRFAATLHRIGSSRRVGGPSRPRALLT